jgi:hypothetical protein
MFANTIKSQGSVLPPWSGCCAHSIAPSIHVVSITALGSCGFNIPGQGTGWPVLVAQLGPMFEQLGFHLPVPTQCADHAELNMVPSYKQPFPICSGKRLCCETQAPQQKPRLSSSVLM